MVSAFENVFHMTQEKEVDMRRASYMVGVWRIAEALKAHGWIKDWRMPFKCNL